MDFYTRYNPCKSKRLPVFGESLTQAHFQHDCDINVMIQRALRGDPSAIVHGSYGDFRNLPELHDALNRVKAAEFLWHELPDKLKTVYGSPEELIKAVDAAKSKAVVKPVLSPSDTVKSDVTPDTGAKPTNVSSTPIATT